MPAIIQIYLQKKMQFGAKNKYPNVLAHCESRPPIPYSLRKHGGTRANSIRRWLIALSPVEIVGCYAAAITFASAHLSLGGALGGVFCLLWPTSPIPAGEALFWPRFSASQPGFISYPAVGSPSWPRFLSSPYSARNSPRGQPAAVSAIATSIVGLSSVLNEGLRGMGMAYPGTAANLLAKSRPVGIDGMAVNPSLRPDGNG